MVEVVCDVCDFAILLLVRLFLQRLTSEKQTNDEAPQNTSGEIPPPPRIPPQK
jgi:hypothetical protein